MIDDELVRDRTAYLESLLPAHVRDRDADTGGLLHELLSAVAAELGLVEKDLESLYDSWFVETAPEWVLPYLVGLAGLPGDLGARSGAGVSRRGVVANTVRYRQRKGTVAVLEQVVRDVTGWPTKAVELYRLVGTTTHVNHVRLDRPTFGSLRTAASAELESPALARGALTRFAHTGEVRHVEPGSTGGRGRYDIPHVGLFVFPVQVYDASRAPARPLGGAWLTHPLGRPSPWFAAPTTEAELEHLAVESDLAVPLRPRRLLALLEVARGGLGTGDDPSALPLAVRVDGADEPLPPERVRVCGLEDLATDPTDSSLVLDGWQVMVDPAGGRVQPYVDGVPYDPSVHGEHTFHVDHASGAMADVGAGTYDRSAVHEQVLEADPFDRPDRYDAQVRVPGGPGAPGIVTLDDGVAAVTAGWDAAEPGGTRVVALADQEDHALGGPLDLPEEGRLVLVAAEWKERTLLDGDVAAPVPGVYTAEGRQPRIVGDVVVAGGAGSALLLDGLVVLGDVRVEPGGLRSLTVSQCTVTGRIVVEADGTPTGRNDTLEVTVVRSLVGGVDLAATVPTLTVTDSVVDPQLTTLTGGGVTGPAVVAAGTHVDITGSTLRGPLECHVLEVSSSICDGVVTVVDRQRGCARFSYLAPGSRAPRRFRCVPASDATTTVGPAYLSRDPASPFYPALAPSTPSAIRRGGEAGAEMGVHHHLRRPLRTDAARRLVEPYVPTGMHIGIFGS